MLNYTTWCKAISRLFGLPINTHWRGGLTNKYWSDMIWHRSVQHRQSWRRHAGTTSGHYGCPMMMMIMLMMIILILSPIRLYTSYCAGLDYDMPVFSVFCHLSRHLAISSCTGSRHLTFGLPRFRFPSTVICKIFLVASSLSRLCTCPNHINVFSLRRRVEMVWTC